jgi:capsular polysaccharide biosynthesis protein
MQHEAIYVARTDTSRRPIRNEAALITALEAEGVRIVLPGQSSIIQQINQFRVAKIVIVGHGSGLTNIVFCPDDAAIYELVPSHYPSPAFNRLAQVRELDYWVDIFPSESQGHEHSRPWLVDIELVKRRLDLIRKAARKPALAEAASGKASGGSRMPWQRLFHPSWLRRAVMRR